MSGPRSLGRVSRSYTILPNLRHSGPVDSRAWSSPRLASTMHWKEATAPSLYTCTRNCKPGLQTKPRGCTPFIVAHLKESPQNVRHDSGQAADIRSVAIRSKRTLHSKWKPLGYAGCLAPSSWNFRRETSTDAAAVLCDFADACYRLLPCPVALHKQCGLVCGSRTARNPSDLSTWRHMTFAGRAPSYATQTGASLNKFSFFSVMPRC